MLFSEFAEELLERGPDTKGVFGGQNPAQLRGKHRDLYRRCRQKHSCGICEFLLINWLPNQLTILVINPSID